MSLGQSGQADPQLQGRETGSLGLKLLTFGTLHVRPTEVAALLKHRYMLAVYLLCLALLALLETDPVVRGLPFELRGATYMAGLAGLVLVAGVVLERALPRLLARGGRWLPISPILALGVLIGVMASEAITRLIAPVGATTPPHMALLFAYYYLTCEVTFTLLAYWVLPRILGELRGLPIRRLSQTDPALWTGTAAEPGMTKPAEAELVEIDGRSRAVADLLHLQAYGNYVRLATRDGQELVGGPLSRLVAQLPAGAGRLVHRSHWVAQKAVIGARLQGRDLTLLLVNGQEVPVATTRLRETRHWLAQNAIGLREGP